MKRINCFLVKRLPLYEVRSIEFFRLDLRFFFRHADPCPRYKAVFCAAVIPFMRIISCQLFLFLIFLPFFLRPLSVRTLCLLTRSTPAGFFTINSSGFRLRTRMG